MNFKKSSLFNNLLGYGRRLAAFSALAASLVTVLSLFGSLSWFLELFTHFRLQLVAGTLAVAGLALLVRMPKVALLCVIVAIVNLSFTLPYLVPELGSAQARPGSIRIMVFNLSARNSDYDALAGLIERAAPDVIGLVEVQNHWDKTLRRLEAVYPHQVNRPEDGYFGLAVVSRFPLRELAESPYFVDDLQTAILAELDLPGASATLVLSHVMAPMSPARAHLRDKQLEDLAGILGRAGNSARILIGDLNITPWSPRYDVLESATGLTNAARRRGYLGTWPSSGTLLRIPIDHCLLSDHFVVQHIETGPDIGSDHLPLIVDVGITGLAGPQMSP